MKAERVTKNFPIVCVGGSAGGLDAYTRLLRHLPADMGIAVVIVNHLRTVATMLPEILPRYTAMLVELKYACATRTRRWCDRSRNDRGTRLVHVVRHVPRGFF
jgi:NADH dehydrogenase FAD-containing subunit